MSGQGRYDFPDGPYYAPTASIRHDVHTLPDLKDRTQGDTVELKFNTNRATLK